jgi:hypothetical protein
VVIGPPQAAGADASRWPVLAGWQAIGAEGSRRGGEEEATLAVSRSFPRSPNG